MRNVNRETVNPVLKKREKIFIFSLDKGEGVWYNIQVIMKEHASVVQW